MADPLRELLGKGERFVWTQNREVYFQRLRALSSCQPLHMFCPKLAVVVVTYVFACGVGAVLQQMKEVELPTVSWAPRTLTPQETKYSKGDREASA